MGTGGRTDGHRWAHCWAQVGGTCVWQRWAPIIRALMISDPDDRVSLDTADHVVKGRCDW
ncbi:unnamed protein product, partial [Staurois parvus]